MTFEDKYGTFENYQRHLCLSVLRYWEPEEEQLRLAVAGSNDYAVRYNLSNSEVQDRYKQAQRAISRAKELLRTGQEDPVYRYAWENLKDKEFY